MKKLINILRKPIIIELELWMLLFFIVPVLIAPIFLLENYIIYLVIVASMFFTVGAIWWFWFMKEWTASKKQITTLFNNYESLVNKLSEKCK